MNKLYFRAWLKDKKEMHNVVGIAFGAKVVELSSTYDRNPICKFDEVILMQGIEINGKVVYEGDIVEFDTRAEGFKGLDVIKGDWRLFEKTIRSLEDLTGVLLFFKETYGARNLKIIGNIYEGEL